MVRLDEVLTKLADSIPAAMPYTGLSLLELTASGPYLLFVTPVGVNVSANAWAVQGGKVVGHLSTIAASCVPRLAICQLAGPLMG